MEDKQLWKKCSIMSKQPYRSELGIMVEILQALRENDKPGIMISTLSKKVNLSHYATLEKCRKLIDAGLVDFGHKEGKRRVLDITEKGMGKKKRRQGNL